MNGRTYSNSCSYPSVTRIKTCKQREYDKVPILELA